ncbi:MAG: MBL fold metallo-hydrolase [Mycoplasma sp.]
MKFYILSTGSQGNSYYIDTGDFTFGLDAGIPLSTTKQFLLKNSLKNPLLYFITHEHGDHISQASAVNRQYNAKIFLHEKITQEVHECPHTSIVPLNYNNFVFLKENDFYFQTFEVPHDVPNIGYHFQIFDSNGIEKNIVYFTDIGNTRILPKKFYDLKHLFLTGDKKQIEIDLILFECNYSDKKINATALARNQRLKGDLGHLSNVEAFKYLSSLGNLFNSTIVLIHASGDNLDKEEDYKIFENFPSKKLIVAYKNLIIDF